MKKVYSIKFSRVREDNYKAIVEAESYEEAMKLFERNPFAYVTDVVPSCSRNVAWNVSEVNEREDCEDPEDKLVYSNNKILIADYE